MLRAALAALTQVGFRFRAGGEPFLDLDDAAVLGDIIRLGATITAEDEAGARMDLMLSGAGLRFDDLAQDAVGFRVGGVEVRVGRSRSCCARRNSRAASLEFMRLYAARLRDQVGGA